MKPLKLLIIEDSKIDAALIIDEWMTGGGKEPLSRRVETPEDFRQALANDTWDVICSDYAMPRFSAMAALQILQDSGQDIPFIVVSGSIGEELAVQALQKGVDDYLMKDNLTRLRPAIERKIQEVRERRARKRAETLLKETENSYRRLIDEVKDYGIFLISSTGTVMSWNAGAERIMGYPAEEIIGQSADRFYTPQDKEQKLPAKEREAALLKGRHEAESSMVRKGGGVFASHNVTTPVYDEHNVLDGFSKILRDITERKQSEAKIRRLAEDLEQGILDRTVQLELMNKELENFTHSVSHDLRAPLRQLAKLSRIILLRYNEQLDQQGREYLAFIIESSQRSLQLINALLDLSQVSSAELSKEPVNLTKMAKELGEELKTSEVQHEVAFKFAKGMVADADAHLMRIALRNLLENAWKFTGKNPDALIEMGTKEEAGETVFYIRDNGVGFDPEYTYKLFQACQRLHSADEFPGTGIGLATVQRIIHRHGGRIWAEGAIGQGSTFYFTLNEAESE